MGRHGIMFLQSFVVVVVVVSLFWPFLMCFSLWKLCDHMSGQGYTLINLNNISLYDLLRGHPRSLENNDLKLKLSHIVYHPARNSCPPHWLPGIQGAAKHCKCSYCIIHSASGYLYLGSLTASFHSMHHILLSIHPHIVEGSRSHGHDSDMIFDLQLGYGQFHGRLALPTPLPPPRPKNRLGRSTRLFLLFLARPCPT